MEMTEAVLIIAVVLILQTVGAVLMKNAAVEKGYGEDSHIFIICFLLGIFGCLYVVALPDKIVQSQNQKIISLLERDK